MPSSAFRFPRYRLAREEISSPRLRRGRGVIGRQLTERDRHHQLGVGQLLPIRDVMPITLLRTVQRHAVHTMEIEYQRYLLRGSPELGRNIGKPGVGIVAVDTHAALVNVGGEPSLCESGSALIAAVNIILPAAREGEKLIPYLPDGVCVQGFGADNQAALGISARASLPIRIVPFRAAGTGGVKLPRLMYCFRKAYSV